MELLVSFKLSDKIYLKDPQSTELGKKIIYESVNMIHELGLEAFTFKKLAIHLDVTEASIYRYFENKHRLLLYILNWYWSYLEFAVMVNLKNIDNPRLKIEAFINMITQDLPDLNSSLQFNKTNLNHIVTSESSKVYLIKEVNEINKGQVFKPYKDLCNTIATIIKEYNPVYAFPHSLASTLIETAHSQIYFAQNLPRLTDYSKGNVSEYVKKYLNDLVFKALD